MNTLTLSQLKKLVSLIKRNHEMLSDMDYSHEYDNSTLAIENLKLVEFLNKRIREIEMDGR
jgi:hypothetical protein